MTAANTPFIHPLLGPDDAWAGYHVEFMPGGGSRQALASLFASPLIEDFDHRQPWFIPALPDNKLTIPLAEHAVTLFPAQADPLATEALAQYQTSLRQAHRKLGLLASPGKKLPVTGTWDYLLLSTSHARSLPQYTLLGLASRTIVVATDVCSHNDRDWLLANACTLSTGEYLLTHAPGSKRAAMSRINLLEILALIAEDADTSKLDAIFRQESKLSYSLLRLVNSAAIAPRNPITSFSRAIDLLGRRQLQRWLQLLVYADPNNGQHPNPLLQKAAARGRQLELLAAHLFAPQANESLEDAAFMVGTFSLLDALLNIPMREILQQLPLTDIVHKALAEHTGSLGELLSAIICAETGDLPWAASKISQLGINADTYRDAQLTSYSWAAKIHTAS